MPLPGPIVDASWLVEHLVDVAILDVRWYLDGRPGRAAYDQGHIHDARFVDLDVDLADPPSPERGRHPLPSPEHFAAAMGRVGVGDSTPVVAYDDAGGSTAARLWWMLHVIGHPVAVLDGGIQAWIGAGYPLETTDPDVPARTFTAKPWPADRFVDADMLDALRSDGSTAVLDARTFERFRGDANPIDPKFGHIPGARSRPWADNLTDGRFRSAHELRDELADELAEAGTVVAYCGSGVTSCHDLLALELAGLGDRGKLYTGSWSQWANDDTRPVEVGE